jgi:hypothetical protein
MEVSGQLYVPAALSLGKEPLVPIVLGEWVGPMKNYTNSETPYLVGLMVKVKLSLCFFFCS